MAAPAPSDVKKDLRFMWETISDSSCENVDGRRRPSVLACKIIKTFRGQQFSRRDDAQGYCSLPVLAGAVLTECFARPDPISGGTLDHVNPAWLALRMARERGLSIDEAAASQVAAKGLLSSPDLSSIDRAVQDMMIVDPALSERWTLIAADAAGVRPNLVTGVYARRIANWQRPDGHWPTVDVRPAQ
jgi:hypothetical protein